MIIWISSICFPNSLPIMHHILQASFISIKRNVISSFRNFSPSSYALRVNKKWKIPRHINFSCLMSSRHSPSLKHFFFFSMCTQRNFLSPTHNKTLGGVCFCMTIKLSFLHSFFHTHHTFFFIQSTDITERAYLCMNLYKHKRIHVDIKWLCRLYLSYRFTYPKNFFLSFCALFYENEFCGRVRKERWMNAWMEGLWMGFIICSWIYT